MKIFEFANDLDLDQVVHKKQSHLDLHVSVFSFSI